MTAIILLLKPGLNEDKKMKTTVTFSYFCDRFKDMGREESFTYEGKKALFDLIEKREEATGSEIELDVTALDRDFYEYDSLEEFHGEYDAEDYPDLDTIRDHTIVIEVPGDGFITEVF